MKRKWKGLWTVFLLAMLLMVCATAGAETVAKIGAIGYETLDAAVAAAVDGDTIIVLGDCTTEGLNLSKDLTIQGLERLEGTKEGTKPKITFTKYGIALWGKALTFKNCEVVMNGIGSTPYTAEWNWMTICASKDASLTLNNAKMTLDAKTLDANNAKKHAIYFCSNNKLNLYNGSILEIKNYGQDALEWDGGDGGYNVNIVDSTFISENNRSGFTGTFYATINNSTVKVNNSRGNGSNGTYYKIENGSNVEFVGNVNWGISAWRIDMTNDSTLTAKNNGYSGIWTRVLNVDGTCTLDVEGNGAKATGFTTNAGIFFQGNRTYTSTIGEGAKVTIRNNAGSGIYTNQKVCNLTIESGTITNNGTGMVNTQNGKGATYGGGVYNIGTMYIDKDVVIYNNHADTAGDDIYNTGTITFGAVGSGWYLDGDPDCYDAIDGWYDDSEEEESDDSVKGGRWEAHDETALHIVKQDAEKYEGLLAIKAAHDIIKPEETPEPSDPGINLTFRKVWDDVGNANRPDSITLKVYRNGEYFRDLKLSYKDSDEKDKNSNTWTFHKYGWSDAAYTVVEVDVSGYASGVEVSENDPDYFIITNTYMPATGDDTPVTRYLLMLGGAALLIAAACVLRARKKA